MAGGVILVSAATRFSAASKLRFTIKGAGSDRSFLTTELISFLGASQHGGRISALTWSELDHV